MDIYDILFWVLSAIAVSCALGVILSRNPVNSVMFLILTFFAISGHYILMNAQFLAVVNVIVYAGAIMVLVVFVIMLLNLGNEEQLKEKFNITKAQGVFFASLLLVLLTTVFIFNPSHNTQLSPAALSIGKVESIGNELFKNYLLPFEEISLLLLTAIVGAIILAKRKID